MDTNKKSGINNDDLQRTISFLKPTISIYDELFQALESNDGWFPQNEQVISFLLRLQTPWCLYYEDENILRGLAKRTFFSDEVSEESVNNLLDEATILLNFSDDAFIDFQKEVESTLQEEKIGSIEDQQQVVQEGLYFIYALITHFFNYLALMIHGRTMCQLVDDAKNGDDNAFRLAVHIDRTVLQLPYFQQRLLRSQFSNDQNFLDDLAASIKSPIIKSKITYRTLRLAFAMLDDMNFLDSFTPSQLLKTCEDLNVTGGADGINDVTKLNYQLKEYRKLKKTSK